MSYLVVLGSLPARARISFRTALIAVALTTILGPAANALSVSARAYVEAGSDSTTQPQVFSNGAPVSNSAALSSLDGFGSASAHGAPGYAGVSALIESDRNFTHALALGSLNWDDDWLITPQNVSLVGTTVRVHPIFSMTGGGTAQSVSGATSSANWSLVAAVETISYTIGGGSWQDVDGGGVAYTGDPLGQALTGGGFVMSLGRSTPVAFSLRATASLDCFRSCIGVRSASVDLANTLHWMGLSITDEDGNPIGGFSVTTASGVDYSQPIPAVPEPGTALLMGSALAVLSLNRARGRSVGSSSVREDYFWEE